jgi:hypothetical protein
VGASKPSFPIVMDYKRLTDVFIQRGKEIEILGHILQQHIAWDEAIRKTETFQVNSATFQLHLPGCLY